MSDTARERKTRTTESSPPVALPDDALTDQLRDPLTQAPQQSQERSPASKARKGIWKTALRFALAGREAPAPTAATAAPPERDRD